MMVCPPEIAEILLGIIEWGLIDIRVLGWDGHADRCAVEEDHIHNLPRLLADNRPSEITLLLGHGASLLPGESAAGSS